MAWPLPRSDDSDVQGHAILTDKLGRVNYTRGRRHHDDVTMTTSKGSERTRLLDYSDYSPTFFKGTPGLSAPSSGHNKPLSWRNSFLLVARDTSAATARRHAGVLGERLTTGTTGPAWTFGSKDPTLRPAKPFHICGNKNRNHSLVRVEPHKAAVWLWL